MKKIILASVTVLLLAGAAVFANSHIGNSNCPNKPGCICTSPANEQQVTAKQTTETCPNRPGCICTK